MLKALQARLQQYGNQELPNVQAGFRKGRATRNEIANIPWIIEKAREFQEKKKKKSTSALLTTLKPYKHNKLWKILKETGVLDHLTFMQVKKQHTNLYAGQDATIRTGYGTIDWFQIREGEHQGCIFHPAYLTYMQITSCKMPGWTKHKLESRLMEDILITSDMQMTPPLWQKVKN